MYCRARKLMALSLVLSLCLTLPSVIAASEGLELYLPFDGNADDASGNGNHGIINGSASWVDGKHGQSMQFDGATYVEVPDYPNSGFDGVPGLTIEVWAKQSTHHDNGIVVKLTEEGVFWPCSYNLETWSDTVAYFGVNEDTGEWIVGPYPLDEWYHLAGVFDNGEERLYINGEDMGFIPDPSSIVPDGDLPVYIGCVDPNSYFFVGELDDVAIYSRALTQEEIQRDMGSIEPASVESTGKITSTWATIKAQ